jgi:hypothetical protein
MTDKIKRPVFRFNGSLPTGINLEHVTSMNVQDKKINFSFYAHHIFVEFETPEGALEVFNELMKAWAGEDVLE